ncbi:MAG: TatD family hydrolase [Oscillospiraceae bacterium]
MYQGIFDSHAHYDDERFDCDRTELLASLPKNGVVGVIDVGCDIQTSRKAIALTAQSNFFYAAVGYHPQQAADFSETGFAEITEMLSHEKVVALGEIGLDYHYDFSPKETQIEVFDRQLQLAQNLDIPVIIHTREATEDTLRLLSKYQLRGVVHCYTGSAETAKMLLKMGYHIGFTGVITFQNARRVVEACNMVPLDRILLETDCPYMSPVPYRGQRNWSPMIEKTAERIAEIKEITPQKLIDIARENTKNLFSLNGAK